MVLASSSASKSADRSGPSPDGISTLPRLFKFHQGQQTWAYDLQNDSPARVQACQGSAAAFLLLAPSSFRGTPVFGRVTDATVFASHKRPFAGQIDVT